MSKLKEWLKGRPRESRRAYLGLYLAYAFIWRPIEERFGWWQTALVAITIYLGLVLIAVVRGTIKAWRENRADQA